MDNQLSSLLGCNLFVVVVVVVVVTKRECGANGVTVEAGFKRL